MPRQDSTTDQLIDVSRMAVEAGCYDANDIIREHLQNQDEGQRYFKLSLSDFNQASTALRAVDAALGRENTGFHVSFVGDQGSAWTEDRAAQRLLRAILVMLGVDFEESDTQQVTTFIERHLQR